MVTPVATLVSALKPKRRWARFSLKSLLGVVTLCCVWLSIEATRPTSIRFADLAARRGIDYQPSPLPRHPMMFGGGCALADFDDDGWLDVLLVDDPNPVLYRNTGHSWFENITALSGLTSVKGRWTGTAVGDYDGDGRLDFLLTGIKCLALLRNVGGATFQDVTVQAELDPKNRNHWGSHAGWMDLDGDEHLDLVILNYVDPGSAAGQFEPAYGEIWLNEGNGSFERLSPSQRFQDTSGRAVTIAFSDIDDDGRVDFYVGNDGTRAELMHNLGGLCFRNIGIEAGLAVGRNWIPIQAMGADWGDFDRDGHLDLIVSDSGKNSFGLFHHDIYAQGGGEKSHCFTELGTRTGISPATTNGLGFGAKWLDMDNDGWPDLCFAKGDTLPGAALRQPISLLQNQLGQRFVDLAPELPDNVARPIVGRGSATGDFNNDGRVDLLIVDYEGSPMLLMNRTRNKNHWITLDLRSRGPNVFAYGAKVTARAGGKVWVGEVSPASSFLSSSDPRIHWGLGATAYLDTITIRWPSGSEETLLDVTCDRLLRVVEREETRGSPTEQEPF